MSTIGTGIAAGVANAGQAARTQSASQSGRDAQRADAAQQADKLMLTQLHNASATRDTDEDMPNGQAPGYEQLYDGDAEHAGTEQDNLNDQIHDTDAPQSSPTGLAPLAPAYGPGAAEFPLFHAIDLKA